MKTSGLKAMIANRLNRANIYNKAEYWNAKAAELEGDAVSMWPNNHLNAHYHREQMAFLDRTLSDITGKKILDVGCGTGRVTRYLAQRGALVQGIDFAENVISIAKKATPVGNPTYRVQSIFDIEDENSFDLIVSWGSVAVACAKREELLDVMTRFCRTLKPGGKIVLLEPIHSTFLHRVLKLNTAETCRVATEAGFQAPKVTPLHFWPARLALAYIRWPRWLTNIGYHVGQGTMRLLGNHRTLGDYKAIEATKPSISTPS